MAPTLSECREYGRPPMSRFGVPTRPAARDAFRRQGACGLRRRRFELRQHLVEPRDQILRARDRLLAMAHLRGELVALAPQRVDLLLFRCRDCIRHARSLAWTGAADLPGASKKLRRPPCVLWP